MFTEMISAGSSYFNCQTKKSPMIIKFYAAFALLFCISIFFGQAQDIAPYTSMVYPGYDGKLVYKADSLGNRIPDFSNAGYKGGGVAIPYVPAKITIWPVKGDNSENIQAAIDKVSAMPLDAAGFRGAVQLKLGLYPLDKPLYIKASGVILRGEGMNDTGTILFGKTVAPTPGQAPGPRGPRPALINIMGDVGVKPLEETKQAITDKYVAVGATTFNVVLAKAFKKGDRILIRRFSNEAWIKEIGEDSITVGARNRWRPFTITYDRIITDVKVNTITVDGAIFTAIDSRWGGGDIVKYGDDRIEQVGVENLRGMSEYDPTVRTKSYGNMDRPTLEDPLNHYEGEEYFSDENHYANFI